MVVPVRIDYLMLSYTWEVLFILTLWYHQRVDIDIVVSWWRVAILIFVLSSGTVKPSFSSVLNDRSSRFTSFYTIFRTDYEDLYRICPDLLNHLRKNSSLDGRSAQYLLVIMRCDNAAIIRETIAWTFRGLPPEGVRNPFAADQSLDCERCADELSNSRGLSTRYSFYFIPKVCVDSRVIQYDSFSRFREVVGNFPTTSLFVFCVRKCLDLREKHPLKINISYT